jgi:acyl carrier protein
VAEIVEELRRKLVELSEGRLDFEEIDPSVSILDYGYVDSLSSVRLLAFIEDRYGVEVPEVELVGRADSLERLAAAIERERAA